MTTIDVIKQRIDNEIRLKTAEGSITKDDISGILDAVVEAGVKAGGVIEVLGDGSKKDFDLVTQQFNVPIGDWGFNAVSIVITPASWAAANAGGYYITNFLDARTGFGISFLQAPPAGQSLLFTYMVI